MEASVNDNNIDKRWVLSPPLVYNNDILFQSDHVLPPSALVLINTAFVDVSLWITYGLFLMTSKIDVP